MKIIVHITIYTEDFVREDDAQHCDDATIAEERLRTTGSCGPDDSEPRSRSRRHGERTRPRSGLRNGNKPRLVSRCPAQWPCVSRQQSQQHPHSVFLY